MSLTTLVTQQAPDFTAEAVMPDNTFGAITLSELKSKYVLLLFYPLDFTFVCPSEILAFNKKLAEFKSRNCEVIGISVDSKFTHLAWKNTPVAKGGIGNIQYPLVQDEFNIALDKKYLPLDQVIATLQSRPSWMHVIITGRNAPPELIAACDLVSEIREIKHPFNTGIAAQKGIEF